MSDPFAGPDPIETTHATARALADRDQLTLDQGAVRSLSVLLRVVAWQVEASPFAAVEAAAFARAVLAAEVAP
jgi:hypothetical protein